MRMSSANVTSGSGEETESVKVRAAELLHAHQQSIWSRTDRMFVRLQVAQWIGGLILALNLSPLSWEGNKVNVHPHVWEAAALGSLMVFAAWIVAKFKSGTTLARHTIAVCQMLSSGLLIHLGGGRIEMHFHVFGSLAFLSFYRDWRVFISASAVVAADHLIRGLFFPVSVFGEFGASNWRWLEHAGWVIFEDFFLIIACARSVAEMQQIALRQAQIEHSYQTVEEKVRERTRELQEVQQEMVKVARSAGMAEIATSVLHNVGNVLNSVNVSLSVATQKVRNSPVDKLDRAVGMMDQHKGDLTDFLVTDARGKQIPGFLRTVTDVMRDEQNALLGEMGDLAKNIEHIKEIVQMQQSNAKAKGVIEEIDLSVLIEDALRVTLSAAANAIEVKRDFTGLPHIRSDKHTLLQILINLTNNAKHALNSAGQDQKVLTVRAQHDTAQGRVRLMIIDNGIGIEPANLTRIFNHGFTTRKDGHGFGLHSSANAAKQLGGSLTVHSDGPGTGACFTLEVPLEKEAAAA
jgi:signal transduction histidine kinase